MERGKGCFREALTKIVKFRFEGPPNKEKICSTLSRGFASTLRDGRGGYLVDVGVLVDGGCLVDVLFTA